MALLEVENLNTYYGHVHALKGISLTVDEGEIVTLIGANGAGKSTLLNLVSGLYPPDRGKVIIDGQNVTNLKEYQRAGFIGRVFQDPMMGTCASMTIEENFSMAKARGTRRGLRFGVNRKLRRLFREKLSVLDLGLEDRLKDKVGLLSGGQRQSLTLLMATLNSPKVLLLDEHTAALDPKTAEQVIDLTKTIVEESGLTTIMVTHNMQQAIAIGTRLIMMHRGNVIMDVKGQEKEKLTVDDLLEEFRKVRGSLTDRTMLTTVRNEAP